MDTPKVEQLRQFLENASEKDSVDYKYLIEDDSDNPKDQKKKQVEFIKNVAGMANIGGGVLIFGVKEAAGKFEMIGISEEEIEKKYDSAKLYDRIKNYLSPAPSFEREIVEKDGKKFVFVIIAGVENTPVLISKEMGDGSLPLIRQGDIYTRKGTQTILAKTDHVQKLIENLVNKKLQSDLERFRPIFNPKVPEIKPTPKVVVDGMKQAFKHLSFTEDTTLWEVSLIPQAPQELPAHHWKRALGYAVEIEGIPYPHLDLVNPNKRLFNTNDGYVIYSYLNGYKLSALTNCFTTGDFFWVSNLLEDTIRKEYKNCVGISGIFRQCSVVFYHALEVFLPHMPQKTKWNLSIRLKNVGGRKLVPDHPEYMPFVGDRYCMDESIEFLCELTPEDKHKSINLTCESVMHFFKMFNWQTDFPTTEDRVRKQLIGLQKIDYTNMMI